MLRPPGHRVLVLPVDVPVGVQQVHVPPRGQQGLQGGGQAAVKPPEVAEKTLVVVLRNFQGIQQQFRNLSGILE